MSKKDKEKSEPVIEPKYIAMGGVVLFAFIIFLTLATIASNKETHKYDDFAKCLVEKEARIYKAWWCPHCQQQEDMFSASWDILVQGGVVIECSPGGIKTFSEECTKKGIQGVPTWFFVNNETLGGYLTFPMLSEQTGCQLPG